MDTEDAGSKMNRSDIDLLTMELMMNKTHYNKYLAKKDPERYKRVQEEIRKIQKYKSAIIDLTTELLDDSTKKNASEKYTIDINDTFEKYLKTCVQYFEMRELESVPTKAEDAEDPDILFASMDESQLESDDTSESVPTTFWGKNIKKKNHSNVSYYTMDRYAKGYGK
jgi:hypothetical protein